MSTPITIPQSRVEFDLLQALLSTFPTDPDGCRNSMDQLCSMDSRKFTRAAFQALVKALPAGEGHLLCLLLFCVNEDFVLRMLMDASGAPAQRAREIAERLSAVDPSLGAKLLKLVTEEIRKSGYMDASVERTLDLVSILPDHRSSTTHLLELLRSSDMRVRSKATLLMARNNQVPRWAEFRLAEPDARVRANAIEGLWTVRQAGADQVLRAATRDSHHRVAVNAWIGLHYLGDPEAVEGLIQLAADEAPERRAAAAWGMGRLGDPVFQPKLQQMARDPESSVRRNALRSLVKIRKTQSEAAETDAAELALESAGGTPDQRADTAASIN